MLNKTIRYFLENKLITFILLAAFIVGGYVTAPFNWESSLIERNPVPVDAIPDIGENQQIVFTKWEGRSPQDIEDQITYPLTTSLSGIPGVKTIRSSSMFGFSSIYIIFEEVVILGFYSSQHKAIFTHHSSNSHMHFRTKDQSLAGHVDALKINDSITLNLPKL